MLLITMACFVAARLFVATARATTDKTTPVYSSFASDKGGSVCCV